MYDADVLIDMYDEDDEPRYRKRRPSGKSKAITKAKHKHTYQPCLLQVYGGDVVIGEYCTQCGKLKDKKLPMRDGILLRGAEALKEFADLPRFRLADMWDQYVAVNKEEE